jgi:hypothetical protein
MKLRKSGNLHLQPLIYELLKELPFRIFSTTVQNISYLLKDFRIKKVFFDVFIPNAILVNCSKQSIFFRCVLKLQTSKNLFLITTVSTVKVI